MHHPVLNRIGKRHVQEFKPQWSGKTFQKEVRNLDWRKGVGETERREISINAGTETGKRTQREQANRPGTASGCRLRLRRDVTAALLGKMQPGNLTHRRAWASSSEQKTEKSLSVYGLMKVLFYKD